MTLAQKLRRAVLATALVPYALWVPIHMHAVGRTVGYVTVATLASQPVSSQTVTQIQMVAAVSCALSTNMAEIVTAMHKDRKP